MRLILSLKARWAFPRPCSGSDQAGSLPCASFMPHLSSPRDCELHEEGRGCLPPIRMCLLNWLWPFPASERGISVTLLLSLPPFIYQVSSRRDPTFKGGSWGTCFIRGCGETQLLPEQPAGNAGGPWGFSEQLPRRVRAVPQRLRAEGVAAPVFTSFTHLLLH